MRPDRDQRTAYHEAAHALSALHVGVVFEHIAMTPDDPELLGRLRRYEYQRGSDLQELFITLAGPTADERMFKLWGAVDGDDWDTSWDSDGPGSQDITEAMEIVEAGLGEQPGWKGEAAAWRFASGMVRSTVRPFVRERWSDIVTLGDALLAAPSRSLTYQDCTNLLGARAA